ncbi:hypothetical protein NMP03_14545 [Sphingomonas qomolangmaensis]|uniref:Transposase n=1 Tax=Sphingomonas qomolangmaensis TaxID=2918765 RepID=A0ABY5L8T7_9SPHN|nr:hypothetical protein [Sphingomonas qomolangmaensis]UUL82376.1 hypothetical protein NMP03_14545 [Sphingomonas qomolangmaensis]
MLLMSRSTIARRTIVLADKAYDSNAIRDLIERQGAVPNIPSKANRLWKRCFYRPLYKSSDAVERMFRLEDYRRISTAMINLPPTFSAQTTSWQPSSGDYGSRPLSNVNTGRPRDGRASRTHLPVITVGKRGLHPGDPSFEKAMPHQTFKAPTVEIKLPLLGVPR